MRGGNIYGILGYIILSPRKKFMFEKMGQVLGLEVSKGEKGENILKACSASKNKQWLLGSLSTSAPVIL